MSGCSTFYDFHSALSGVRPRGNIGIDIPLSAKKGRFPRQNLTLYIWLKTQRNYTYNGVYSSSTSILSIYLIFNTIQEGGSLFLHLSKLIPL